MGIPRFLGPPTPAPQSSSTKLTVNDLPLPQPSPLIAFAYTPKGNPFTWSAGINTYTPADAFYTPVGTPITFTAQEQWPTDDVRYSVEYIWDFGDGVAGYGPTPTHTYLVANLQAQTVLEIIDNEGVHWFTRKQMYLQKLGLTILTPSATVLHS